MAQLSRRDAIKAAAALAGGSLVACETASAQTVTTGPATAPAASATTSPGSTSTAPTSMPTTLELPVTPDDVAVADRIAGRAAMSEEKRRLVAGTLTGRRGGLRGIRAAGREIAYPTVSPTHFSPWSAAQSAPAVTPPGPFSWSSRPLPEWDGSLESLAFASIRQLARLLRARRVTSEALTRFFLDRLRKHGPRLHCVVTLTEDRALTEARRADADLTAGIDRGPLHGIPYGVKDLFDAAGTPTTCGVSPWKDRVATTDATLIARMTAGGAVLCAKLSLGELAMGDVWFGGLTRNPWAPATGSSGSSAGSASAVAAGLLPLAIGTETLGSIVSPCCVCGTTGLRPTFGLLSREGGMPLCPSMDKPGPITRYVEDAAAALHVLAGPDPLDPTTAHSSFSHAPDLDLRTLRVGFDGDVFTALERRSPETFVPYAEVLKTLRGLGVDPKPISLPRERLAQGVAGLTIVCEGAAALSELTLSDRMDELIQQEPASWPNAFRSAEHVPAPDYLRCLRLRARMIEQWREALKDLDCYLAVPRSGPSLVATNLTGHPSLVTRCGLTPKNEPIMLELIGNLHQEPALLALATAYEAATDHHTRWPDPRAETLPAARPS